MIPLRIYSSETYLAGDPLIPLSPITNYSKVQLTQHFLPRDGCTLTKENDICHFPIQDVTHGKNIAKTKRDIL